ncbi:MAG: hypothetical protein SFT91_03840, partial [Rickettsiaceae bacterium]|nr:hypothetical protein [Rickettsiaceae bacterium]
KSVLKIASNIDKHKFNYRNNSGFLIPGKTLYSLKHKPSVSRSRFYAIQNRYRSNMMVYYQER